MKNLVEFINEQLATTKGLTTPRSRQELIAAILKHFKSHNGDLNDIDVSELDEKDFDSLFYDLRDEINKNKITEINISDWTLKQLYYGMFEKCETLDTVILPEYLQMIGDNTFYDCRRLRRVDIPISVTHIGSDAFAHCYNLT